MSPFCLGNQRFSFLNYLVLITSLYKGNRALKGGLLSQFWRRNQRLMPLVPRTPTAGRCGPGHLCRACSQAEIGSITTGSHPLQPSGAASEEVGTEGLREHFFRGRVGVRCTPYLNSFLPLAESEGPHRDNSESWPIVPCDTMSSGIIRPGARIPSGKTEGARIQQVACWEAGKERRLRWLGAALQNGARRHECSCGQGLTWDPNPEGSQKELSRLWVAWSTRAQVGGDLRQERHCLFLGVAVQGHHQGGASPELPQKCP